MILIFKKEGRKESVWSAQSTPPSSSHAGKNFFIKKTKQNIDSVPDRLLSYISNGIEQNIFPTDIWYSKIAVCFFCYAYTHKKENNDVNLPSLIFTRILVILASTASASSHVYVPSWSEDKSCSVRLPDSDTSFTCCFHSSETV